MLLFTRLARHKVSCQGNLRFCSDLYPYLAHNPPFFSQGRSSLPFWETVYDYSTLDIDIEKTCMSEQVGKNGHDSRQGEPCLDVETEAPQTEESTDAGGVVSGVQVTASVTLTPESPTRVEG